MAKKTPEYAWFNGGLVPWGEAKIHVHTDAVRYGANVFEGIRAYASPDKQQLYVFKLKEHMDRLFGSSMKILRMQLKWGPQEISDGLLAMLRANKFHEDVHIRPLVYFGGGEAY